MPGKKFLYSRVLMSETPKDTLERIHTYLGQEYHINVAKVLEYYQSDKDMREVGKSSEFTKFQKLFNNSTKDTAWHLYLHLVVGEKEAASYLAESLRNSYGTVKDDFLADLTLAIGAELQDQESIKLIAVTPISSQIKDLAKKCVPEITQHKLGVEGREIWWDEIMARGKALAYYIEQASGHSYYEAIEESEAAGIKYWSNYVTPMYCSLSDSSDEISMAGSSSS
ncbi:hypothetical protein [Candidatus Tisiphia endosymbiont of Beris chalybata]|uniref:hypothetical protein n=1 Tax=Candidatus Tisiphia endosymbiont of Beris chalybata TaxID=3066262 RepID=UPI00312C8B66